MTEILKRLALWSAYNVNTKNKLNEYGGQSQCKMINTGLNRLAIASLLNNLFGICLYTLCILCELGIFSYSNSITKLLIAFDQRGYLY